MKTGMLIFLIFLFGSVANCAKGNRIQRRKSALSTENVQLLPITENSTKNSSSIQTWQSLKAVSSDKVTECSIAGDENRLLVFYHEPRPDLNLDEGIVKEWDGSTWTTLDQPTNDCHQPDAAVNGNIVVVGWETQSPDYGFASNITGQWISLEGNLLVHSFGTRVAVAQGIAYLTYAARVSDGQPFSYMMLHIHCPLNPGKGAELNGGWTVPYTDVGINPDIAGDENNWISVSTQNGGVSVKEGSVSGTQSSITDLGNVFHVKGTANYPGAAIRMGIPTVFWLEGISDTLYVAEWSGTEWKIIGEGDQAKGYFVSVRAAVASSNLFLAYNIYDGANYKIVVDQWNGNSWAHLSDVLRSSSSSDIYTLDITTYKGLPVVSFIENDSLKVEMYSQATPVKETQVPYNFSLAQNYPNPFNPTTNFEFRIAEFGLVTLKVYDILGNEVATIVNENKQAGKYKVKFNADTYNLPSGVYIYQLKSGKFISSKKFVLIK